MASIPDDILARCRWLADNPKHPDATVAAAVLADEILAWVNPPEGGFINRETLFAERQRVADLIRHALTRTWHPIGAMDLDGGLDALYRDLAFYVEPSRVHQTALVAVPDPADLTPEGVYDAEEQLLAGLARLNWQIRRVLTSNTNRVFRDSIIPSAGGGEVVSALYTPPWYDHVQIRAPGRFYYHLIDPRTRSCLRCKRPEAAIHAGGRSNRVCYGSARVV